MSFLNRNLVDSKEVVTSWSDEEILEQSQRLPELFGELVNRYQAPFFRRARKVLGSDEAAEDAVQETFVKMYVKAGKFKRVTGASLSSWGYKILLNTCFTEYRKMRRTLGVSVPMDEELEAVLGDEGGFQKRLELDYFLSIASKLPVTMARMLRLFVVEGLSPLQISVREHLSIGAVRTRFHRAKKAFQKMSLELA